jgi:hypothetical protein
MTTFASQYLGVALATFRKYRALGEGAMDQLRGDEILQPLEGTADSIATIVKHLRGNMRSRWQDFLTTDGEKPDRDRDSEFELRADTTPEAVRGWWEEGWGFLFGAVEALRPTDLERTVTIRGEPLSVLQAIDRQLTHTAYHVGQIVILAKRHRGEEWRSLSLPRRAARTPGEAAESGGGGA